MTHNASLVHFTKDGDELIAHMARVSNPAGQEKASEASGLIAFKSSLNGILMLIS